MNADGYYDILEAITVTRSHPVATSIPVINNGQTIHKQVTTAETKTEVVQPEDIIQTEVNGEIKLLLSTIQNGNQLSRVLVEPVETSFEITSAEFVNGRRTKVTQVIPSQAFNVVTMTEAQGGDVQNLLKLLLAQQQNPLLAALGLNQSPTSEVVRTSTYVTTVTSVLSTLLPIMFRGRKITTTVVTTKTDIITATELVTETVSGVAGLNPVNQLLPLLLQNQIQQQQVQTQTAIQGHASGQDSQAGQSRFKRQPSGAAKMNINFEDVNMDMYSPEFLEAGKWVV